MPLLRIGLQKGNKEIRFNKPYEYISVRDVLDAVNERVIGWFNLTPCMKYKY
jgi:hypothetical protein